MKYTIYNYQRLRVLLIISFIFFSIINTQFIQSPVNLARRIRGEEFALEAGQRYSVEGITSRGFIVLERDLAEFYRRSDINFSILPGEYSICKIVKKET